MYWIGFDVGGTFVDLFAFDLETGRVQTLKRSSSRDRGEAVREGLRELLAAIDGRPEQVVRLAHGTTLATNILVERSGARVGVLTTQGFRDVLEIGRMRRPSLYDLTQDKPAPLAPRSSIVEVAERIGPDGEVVEVLDATDLARAVARLVDENVEAVAVCFLHAYANSAHEEQAARAIDAAGLAVSVSTQVSAEYGEFERFTTAVLNSYLMPTVARYLADMDAEVKHLGVPAPVRIMQSNGGVIEAGVAARFPVRLLSSGPAAGVIGASILADQAERDRLITLDIGGTSADVSLVVDGQPAYASEHEIDGYPVRAVGVDIRSIGAGGGSIARLDRTGALCVGPESAGADPGPACYGAGGTRPTLTDADLILGYLNAERFCGGVQALRPDLAAAALADAVATPRRVSVDEAALGVLRVCITNMVGAVRNITTQRGYDPRDFTLVAFGGAGPVHAAIVAAELNIPEVLVPAETGLLSAKGLLLTNYRADVYRTAVQPLLDADCGALSALVATLERDAVAQLPAVAGGGATLRVRRILELCYEGQENVVPVALESFPVTADHLPALARELDRRFESIYGFVPVGRAPKLLHVRVFAERVLDVRRLLEGAPRPGAPSAAAASPAKSSFRDVLFASDGRRRVPVYDRDNLVAGARIDGPAIVEEDYSNTVVCPGQRLRVDAHGNLLIAVEASGA